MLLHELFSEEEFAILQQRAKRVAAPIQEERRSDSISALRVSICGEQYALPINSITLVYRDIAIVPVPCVPNFVAGIANVRGHLITVLDLASLLGLESDDAPVADLVMAKASDAVTGFRVETIGEVVELAADQINSVTTNMNLAHAAYLQGILPDGTALLNIEAILEDPRLIVDETTA